MIIIGSDHAGYSLKEEIKNYLQEINEDIVDVGAYSVDAEDNFSEFVVKMVKAYNMNKTSKIIAICGSGVGMNIGLNKNKGIFCVLGHNKAEVEKAREHNNVNALSLGGRVTSLEDAKEMISAFLNTNHLGGKYEERMKLIDIKD